MEPVTHFLTGACIGRAGLNRKTAYATLAAVLAAEAADLDIFWGFAGPVDELKHHRGITHTFWAVPVVAGVWSARCGCSTMAWREKRRIAAARDSAQDDRTRQSATALTTAHGHPLGLALSHRLASPRSAIILLDWTNNYGVRPFFPLNPHWYAGSFMFIVEPIL